MDSIEVWFGLSFIHVHAPDEIGAITCRYGREAYDLLISGFHSWSLVRSDRQKVREPTSEGQLKSRGMFPFGLEDPSDAPE
ncbi:hypothetical protein [Pseudomonas corrugata]|uniref:hypothetical protein n=1 Tax=Pseudomonas corrugata TaxID=47879 RepID=UPI00158667A6|nr:hypothetical protein [Pseudomonas corrugata]MCI0992456.1 hypothetical protein [Pseudomonas corrugata]NUT66261.1 hypothetical protein [Pseudomonas corrugata]